MDPQNPFTKFNKPSAPPQAPLPPGALPIVENMEMLTHTMKEDMIKAQGVAGAGNEAPKKTPFSETIPPPPLPPNLQNNNPQPDMYRESLESKHPGVEAVPMPSEESEEEKQKLKIFIPTQKRNLSPSTIVLSIALVLLIAGGGMGYYFFFIIQDRSGEQVAVETPITPPEPAPAPISSQPAPIPDPEPIPEPIPEPEPQLIIEPIPEPTPIPEPIQEPEPIIEPIPEPTIPPQSEPQPIPEPAIPQAAAQLDQTVIIEIGALDKQMMLSKLSLENAKLAGEKVTVKYLIKLSTPSEKRFLAPKEWADLLELKFPANFWQYISGMELVGYKSGNTWRYGLIAKINNKDQVKDVMGNWQIAILTDLKPLYIEKTYTLPAKLMFAENSYFDFYKRYVNLPTQDISMDYAISSDYFVVATSKDMIYSLLTKIKSINPDCSTIKGGCQ